MSIFQQYGIRNDCSGCYHNCFLQIMTNYSLIFHHIANFKQENELGNLLYMVIQKLVLSDNEISANSFLTQVGRDLNINNAHQPNFFDILNGLCKKLQIISVLFKFYMDIDYFKKISNQIPYFFFRAPQMELHHLPLLMAI